MQKTKLGISVGMLGALLFFMCLFGGYLISVILAGYILLFEENAWLRKSAVKGVAVTICFSILFVAIQLIPDAFGLIGDICRVFNGSFYLPVLNNIVAVIRDILDLAEKLLFLLLGVKAFSQGTVKIPFIDTIINKYMA